MAGKTHRTTVRSISCPDNKEDEAPLSQATTTTRCRTSRLQKNVVRLTTLMKVLSKPSTLHENTTLNTKRKSFKKGQSLDESVCGPRQLETVFASKMSKRSLSLEDIIGDEDSTRDLLRGKSPRPVLSFGTLKNGQFSAEILLRDFPQGGQVTVYIKSSRLDFYWQLKPSKKASGRYRSKCPLNQCPIYCSNVELPMYVDPQTLKLSLASEHMISMFALTKGYLLLRRKSVSSDSLPRASKSTKSFSIKDDKLKTSKRSYSALSIRK